MIKGTTPKHTFVLPFDTILVKQARVSYGQYNKEVLCKKVSDCEIEGNQISCTLTQEETFKFDHKIPLQIQVRIQTQDGSVISSDIITADVDESLNQEVL